ncbi:hypothetical protein GQX73_g8412 [Xylaria multiplex]|uniref:Uncharacterized protein n=1 Tax=Xylaria multiplex TaxID=323545 RepID=A0A7C8MQ29_9PEZI|nr:hypothetical protein GQX73_g8412 [Xylaria multiplex]
MGSTQPTQHFNLFGRTSEVFTFDNTSLLTVTGISFLCGYLQYYYSIRLSLSEGKGPFPLWMHLFYFAHDTSWAYLLNDAAPDYGYHWFMTWSYWGIRLWNVLEIVCIYRAVFVEGEDVASDQLRRRSKWQSLWYIAVMTAMMYGFIFLGIVWMGPTCFFEWGAICNIIMAFGPTTTWLRRGSRDGLSISLALVIVVSTIFTFAPFSMWIQVAPEIFDHPTYYFVGLVLTVLSITNVLTIANYPPKSARKGQSAPIW